MICFNCKTEIDTDYYEVDTFGEHWCEHCWPEADPRLFAY